MTLYQKRFLASVLAVLCIVVSMFLWVDIVRGLVTPVADIAAEESPVSEAESSSSSAQTVPPHEGNRHSAASLQTSSLMPSLHFSGMAARIGDEQKNDELKQWEIQEVSTLSIPSLSIRSPVFLPSKRYWDTRDWETLERQMQVGLLYGVVSYPHAVAPGAQGTIVIAGHSSPPNDRARESRFGSIFAVLPDIEEGAQIIMRTQTATATYVVIDTQIVPSGDTTILLGQQEESLLKLITCYPVGSTKERFVVIAKKVEE